MNNKETVRNIQYMNAWRYDLEIDEDDDTGIANKLLLELLEYISELESNIIELDDVALELIAEKESVEEELSRLREGLVLQGWD